MDLEGAWASTSGTFSMTSNVIQETNPHCAQAFASLRLFGDLLVPEEISRLLSLVPTSFAAKGSRTVAASGKSRVAPTGRWILESRGHVTSTDLEQHIAWLLDRLDEAGIAPTKLPAVSRADVFCFWVSATGTGGPEFSPELLGRLAKCHLALGLDIYFEFETS